MLVLKWFLYVFTLWSGLMWKHVNISLDWAGSDSRSPEAGITREDHCYWKSPESENRTLTLPVPSTFTQQILAEKANKNLYTFINRLWATS